MDIHVNTIGFYCREILDFHVIKTSSQFPNKFFGEVRD